MNRPKPPPVDLDKYLEGRTRNYVTYEDGARMYGMTYWGFVRLCQEIGANIPLRKTSIVDTEIVEAYIEEHTLENEEEKEKTEMARRKIEDLEELIKLGKKKNMFESLKGLNSIQLDFIPLNHGPRMLVLPGRLKELFL